MGLVRGVARTAVVAGTASAVAGRVQRRQQNKWAAQDAAAVEEQPQQQYAPPPQAAYPPQQAYAPQPPAAAPADAGGDDLVSNLQRLEGLRQQGILTEEEFAAAKAKLLGG